MKIKRAKLILVKVLGTTLQGDNSVKSAERFNNVVL